MKRLSEPSLFGLSQSMRYYDIHSAAKFFCSGTLTPAADFSTAKQLYASAITNEIDWIDLQGVVAKFGRGIAGMIFLKFIYSCNFIIQMKCRNYFHISGLLFIS